MALADYARFLLAFAFVLGLIGLGAIMLRRFGPGAARIRPGGARRLFLVESLPLDPRRRLVLVRRDGKEHLILLGPQNDALIEAGIDAPPDGAGAVPPASDGVAKRFDDAVRRLGARARSGPAADSPPASAREDSA